MGGRGSKSGAKGGRSKYLGTPFDPASQQAKADEWLNQKHSEYSVLSLTDEYGGIQEFETYSAKGLAEHIKDIVDTENGSLYDEYTAVYIKYRDGREFYADGGQIVEMIHDKSGRLIEEKPVKRLRTTGIETYTESNSATDVLYGKGNRIYYDDSTQFWRSD